MGQTIAMIAHILGTLLAAFLIYITVPIVSEILGTEIEFNYIVLFSLLSIWSVREGKKIESGKHTLAIKLDEIFYREDK